MASQWDDLIGALDTGGVAREKPAKSAIDQATKAIRLASQKVTDAIEAAACPVCCWTTSVDGRGRHLCKPYQQPFLLGVMVAQR